MIVPARDLADTDALSCDVCVIGSGPAGVSLVRELGLRGIDSICVAGGGTPADSADQDLYRGHIPRPRSHEPLEANRARAFGGSSTLWGGRLVSFDPIDFERRDYVPLSGWPIKYSDLAAYIPRAMEIAEVPPASFVLDAVSRVDELPADLGGTIATDRLERWSMPTDFGVRYAEDLRRGKTVRVLLDQHCVDLILDESRCRATKVVVRSRAGGPIAITARHFVMACGGLENPRLLLAARSQLEAGIGNQHDMVGRCYMSHVFGSHGFLRLRATGVPAFYRLSRDAGGMYFRRRLWLRESAQRSSRLMNIIAFPFRPEIEDPDHRDHVLSLMFLQEWATRAKVRRRTAMVALGCHLRNVVMAPPTAWLAAAHQLRQRYFANPRRPFLLPHQRRNRDSLFFQSEHAPNRESRVVLSRERDEFGMPRLEPHIAFSSIDEETVVGFYSLLDGALRREGVGHLEWSEELLRTHLRQTKRDFNSNAHHIGTTRMAVDPREGVVDPDCRVHGVGNLFIAGSSVFPTSGHANPTLMILALTLRLADHLARVVSGSDCDGRKASR